jgi:hypothetical protein
MSRSFQTLGPKFSRSSSVGDGRIRIRHKEYISEINNSINFSTVSFPINPGMALTFPWLAPIAPQFESYLFHSLKFSYQTECTTSSPGSLMLANDYDASDPAPASKIQMMSYRGAVRSSVWNECVNIADPKDLAKFGVQRYVRSGAPPPSSDIKTFDVGNLFVGTHGGLNAGIIGELYVEYDIELFTPQTDLAAKLLANSATYASGSNTSLTLWMGLSGTGTKAGGLDIIGGGNDSIFRTPGEFFLDIYFVGTTFTALPVVSGTALSTPHQSVTLRTADGTGMVCRYSVKVLNANETFILACNNIGASLTSSFVHIASFAYNLG